MKNAKRDIPEFRSEEEERVLRSTHDSTEHVDGAASAPLRLPKLKATVKTIALRLPVAVIEDWWILANKRDVPYPSLLKVFLAERIAS